MEKTISKQEEDQFNNARPPVLTNHYKIQGKEGRREGRGESTYVHNLSIFLALGKYRS